MAGTAVVGRWCSKPWSMRQNIPVDDKSAWRPRQHSCYVWRAKGPSRLTRYSTKQVEGCLTRQGGTDASDGHRRGGRRRQQQQAAQPAAGRQLGRGVGGQHVVQQAGLAPRPVQAQVESRGVVQGAGAVAGAGADLQRGGKEGGSRVAGLASWRAREPPRELMATVATAGSRGWALDLVQSPEAGGADRT